MPPLVSAEDLIRRAPVGFCLYSLSRLDAAPEETDFLIREETARIQAWRSPAIEFRSGAITEEAVVLVPILIRVQDELYECWVNHWAEANSQRVLGTLAIQERLVLHCFGDEGTRIRSLRVSNPHRAFFAEVSRTCATAAPWSMPAFDAARERLYTRHPSVRDLWNALRRTSPPPPRSDT